MTGRTPTPDEQRAAEGMSHFWKHVSEHEVNPDATLTVLLHAAAWLAVRMRVSNFSQAAAEAYENQAIRAAVVDDGDGDKGMN